MATAAADEKENVLRCTVCLDSYTDPCTLQCKHSFCRRCITTYVKTQADAVKTKTIPCPSCRQVTRVPDPSRPVDEWAGQLQPGHMGGHGPQHSHQPAARMAEFCASLRRSMVNTIRPTRLKPGVCIMTAANEGGISSGQHSCFRPARLAIISK